MGTATAEFCGTKIYVEVVGRDKNWFVKVKRIDGNARFGKDAVLLGPHSPGYFGTPSEHHPRLRFTSRRELREAVKRYNQLNGWNGGYTIIGGLH